MAAVLGAVAAAGALPARAWSSQDYPLFEPVHQEAIAQVLGKELTADLITLLQAEQSEVDKDQAPEQSAEHSMTGIEKEGQDENRQRILYVAKAEQFVSSNLQLAIERRKAGALREAMQALGKAIHPMTDATSPAHHSFQTWSFKETLFEKARHVANERVYPSDGKEAPYRTRLEAAVRWAYEIYMQRAPMPAHFFDATGELCLPSTCTSR